MERAIDLTTTYLGLELAHPVVASAGPLSQNAAGVRALAGGGASAVVLYSLFEEQLRAEANRDAALLDAQEDRYPEATDFFPDVEVTAKSAAYGYLKLVEESAAQLDVPVIASLNGSDLGGWVDFARELASAGASALELNIYFVPGDVRTTGDLVLKRHLEIVQAVTQAVELPVSVKLSSSFSSPGNAALQILDAGASGLVLFNRFLQPDIDIETLGMDNAFELSTPHEGRLPRTWIAAIRNHTQASLAGSTGVESADDVIKYLLAGADVVMSTAALIRHGRDHTRTLVAGLESWLARKGYASVAEARGLLALPADGRADAFERGGYVAALQAAKQRYGSL
ncbi:dihydroorotate dehydrogenase-like protein [Propioniciclava soli]|uniref:dihydroorotate dehydrogenase-like protein n=1 Tax=Propioniciclava soli TaxID=2775081 RepID=UPI001E3C8EB5|nr:dihydroorotate dehydrogenase-like protein [Propioniciclava soli]